MKVTVESYEVATSASNSRARRAGGGRDRADREGPNGVVQLQARQSQQRYAVMIPPFMSAGERILVSTETGEYVRRAD
jgi:hypothetical protein